MSLMELVEVLGRLGTEILRLGSFGTWIAAWIIVLLEEEEDERRDEAGKEAIVGRITELVELEWQWWWGGFIEYTN